MRNGAGARRKSPPRTPPSASGEGETFKTEVKAQPPEKKKKGTLPFARETLDPKKIRQRDVVNSLQ